MVLVVLGQFVAHVSRREDMNTGGDQRHHHEHQDGQSVDVVVDRDDDVAEPGELVELAGKCGAERVEVGMVSVDVVGVGVCMGSGSLRVSSCVSMPLCPVAVSGIVGQEGICLLLADLAGRPAPRHQR